MKTIWAPQAKESLRQIAKYIQSDFGSKARKNFINEVRKRETLLKSNPNIGMIDPLFAHRQPTYRSVIINGLNKMVYYVENNTIYIAAFWDTRREPNAQVELIP